jgi:hypothetical protein
MYDDLPLFIPISNLTDLSIPTNLVIIWRAAVKPLRLLEGTVDAHSIYLGLSPVLRARGRQRGTREVLNGTAIPTQAICHGP